MQDTLARMFENLAGRASGPLHFRVFLQPLMAAIVAFRDGRRDARERKTPYFVALFTDKEHRSDLLRNGWHSVGKVFLMALAVDAGYQFWVVRWFYPGEAILVALILAIIPYVVFRGLVNRFALRKAKVENHARSDQS